MAKPARSYSGKSDALTYDAEVARGSVGLAVTCVTVTAPLPGGVTQNALKRVPLAQILRTARAELAPAHAGPVDIPKTSGRTEMSDELLRAVALAYIDETGPAKDRRAIQRMAERFDRPEGTLRTWIARARKEGWLAPGSKGRIGAEPGPQLLAGGGTQWKPPCKTCRGKPPRGFTCSACGAETLAGTVRP